MAPMGQIISPTDFNVERRLLEQLGLSFDSLPQDTINSLKDSLATIDPLQAQSMSMLGLVMFEGVKQLVRLMEAPTYQDLIPVSVKSPLVQSGLKLFPKLEASPVHAELLPEFLAIRDACKAIHDGFHRQGKGFIAPHADVHTAVHAIGQLAMVMTFLPQLRRLSEIRLPEIPQPFDLQKFLPASNDFLPKGPAPKLF